MIKKKAKKKTKKKVEKKVEKKSEEKKIDIKNASREQLADVIGLKKRQITILFQEGVVKKNKNDKYDLCEAVPDYIAYCSYGKVNEQRVKGKNRLDVARAEKEEMLVAKLKKLLIPLDDAQIAINEAMVIIGTQLDGIGGRMASELAGISEPAIVRQKLLNETRRIRKAAADKLARLATIGDGVGDTKTAARQASRSVGKSNKGVAAGKC